MSGRGKVSAVEVSYQFSPRASEALPEEMQRPRPRLACLSPGNQRGSGYFVGQLCRTADCTPAPPHLHGFGAHRTPGGGGGGAGTILQPAWPAWNSVSRANAECAVTPPKTCEGCVKQETEMKRDKLPLQNKWVTGMKRAAWGTQPIIMSRLCMPTDGS